MDSLYDGYYKWQFEDERKKALPSMRRRAERVIFEAIVPEMYQEGDNRLTWADSFLRLGSTAAAIKLDRLEADSKFFRSLAVVSVLCWGVLFSPLTGWTPAPLWHGELAVAGTLLVLSWVLRRALKHRQEINEAVKRELLGAGGAVVPWDELPGRLEFDDHEWLEAERRVSREEANRLRIPMFILLLLWLLLAAGFTYTNRLAAPILAPPPAFPR